MECRAIVGSVIACRIACTSPISVCAMPSSSPVPKVQVGPPASWPQVCGQACEEIMVYVVFGEGTWQLVIPVCAMSAMIQA
jgi:hypothetical protein